MPCPILSKNPARLGAVKALQINWAKNSPNYDVQNFGRDHRTGMDCPVYLRPICHPKTAWFIKYAWKQIRFKAIICIFNKPLLLIYPWIGFWFPLFLFAYFMYGQDIQLLQEFNGRYDYLAFGNTLNKEEKWTDLCLWNFDRKFGRIYYWNPEKVYKQPICIGRVREGDFDVALNGNPITAERTFSFLERFYTFISQHSKT